MKKLLLTLLVIVGLNQTVMADILVGSMSGKLKWETTQKRIAMHLKAGDYKYELILTGNDKVKTRLRINQDQWINSQIAGDDTVDRSLSRHVVSGWADTVVKKKLLDRKNMSPKNTFTGTFHVYVDNTSLQTTDKREVRAKVSKPAGGRTLNYNLKIYKVTAQEEERQIITKIFTNPTIGSRKLDFCKTWGKECGEPAATYFCQRKGMTKASEWEEDRDIGNTLVLGDNKVCDMAGCDGFKSITCVK